MPTLLPAAQMRHFGLHNPFRGAEIDERKTTVNMSAKELLREYDSIQQTTTFDQACSTLNKISHAIVPVDRSNSAYGKLLR